MKSNIIMIGMPGSGKSTVGKVLAEKLRMGFLDTDDLLIKQEHMPLQDVLDLKGVDYFLEAEERAILNMDVSNTVIATGGSVALSKTAMKHLGKSGSFVYLNVGYYDISQRIKNIDTRGIVFRKGQGLIDIYSERTPIYRSWADTIIRIDDDEHMSVEEIVVAIIKDLIIY